MDCSIVIPVYNSETILPELIEQLGKVLPTVCVRFQVILVNDGSRDGSWDVICHQAAAHDWVQGINFMRNYGQHNALLAGIRAARGQVIVTMDDDLQHPPEEIPHLLAGLSEELDVVYGKPQVQQHGLWRNLSSSLSRAIISSAMGVRNASDGSAFRAFRTPLREAFADYSSPYVVLDVLLTWATTRFGSVTVRHNRRRAGRSNYGFFQLAILALDLTTGFSTWPLRLASFIGFAVTLLGLGLFILVLIQYLITEKTLSVYRFFTAIVAIFSGAQLFTLGIIGEYLARMHLRLMARPPYTIRERTDHGSGAEVTQHV